MELWEWLTAKTDELMQKTPPEVTEALKKGYDASVAATAQADDVVRAKARELHEYFSDDEARENFSKIAVNLSKNGALYLVRSYGGGPIVDIVSRSVQNSEVDSHKGKIKELEARVSNLEKELNARKALDQVETLKMDKPALKGDMNRRSGDALQNLLTKQISGVKLFDSLIIPGMASRTMDEPVSNTDGSTK